METILRVLTYLRRYPLLASAQLASAVISTLMVIVFPEVTRVVIDDVIPNGKAHLLWPMVFITLGAFFTRDFFNGLRIVLNNIFEQKVIFDLRSDLYGKIQRLPLRWFDNKPTGDVMTRVAEDVTAMERVLIDGIEQGLVAALQVCIVGFVLFTTDAGLAWIALIPLPLLAIGAASYTFKARDRYRLTRQATGEMNSLLHDNIAGIRQIKAYTMEEEEHRQFNKASDKVRRATLKVMRAWAIYSPTMSFLSALGFTLVLGFGGHAALRGSLELGELAKFLLLLSLFYDPVGRLHSLNQLLQAGRASAERVFQILDAEEEPHMTAGEELPRPVRGEVRYEDVHFSYTGTMKTLHGIDLHARPGQTIALVGPTGAGKSTIIGLLTRFYEYGGGRILIDGHEIHTLAKTSLRGAIGYVTQESFLFNGTVRENLTIAKRDATDDEIWDALAAANAKAFVDRFPEKLETNVGERGVKLSVGEKQRVSIARALLRNPPILCLDEATASVDTETEHLIQEALEHLMANRTSFVIAHRLSTVRRADRIYVFNDGRVVEEGDHDALLEQKGLYHQLWTRTVLDAEEALLDVGS